MGWSVAGVPDMDGDGASDVLIGARYANFAGDYSGSAYLYSGADGSLIHRFDSDAPWSDFGTAVASAGDVNGDTIADLVITATAHDLEGRRPNAGAAYIYSGADLSLLRRIEGVAESDYFGRSVAAAGDLDGDGLPELLLGAADADPGGFNGAGSVWIVSACCAPVAINQGAACTNSTNVTLSMVVFSAQQMRFRNEGDTYGAWEPYQSVKSWTLPMGDGTKRIYAEFIDGLGNESAEVMQEITLDTQPATADSVTIQGGLKCTAAWDVTLTVSATDAAEMRFRNETGAWSAWVPYATTKNWTLSPGRGLKTVGFQVRDACGFASSIITDTIRIPTFEDVPCGHSQWDYIEALVAAGITSGCQTSPPLYCPLASITRAQMAVFLCRAAGKGPLNRDVPTFADVPKTNPYYGYIERLADPASWPGGPPTSGCRADNPATPENEAMFCPYQSVTREQMAKFLCIATGRSPMPSCSGKFVDAGTGNPFCRYIERLTDGPSWPGGVPVTSGCVCPPGYPPGSQCYCPTSPVTRGQMAVFLVRAFGIPM